MEKELSDREKNKNYSGGEGGIRYKVFYEHIMNVSILLKSGQ